jgi:hypothetical protein
VNNTSNGLWNSSWAKTVLNKHSGELDITSKESSIPENDACRPHQNYKRILKRSHFPVCQPKQHLFEEISDIFTRHTYTFSTSHNNIHWEIHLVPFYIVLV